MFVSLDKEGHFVNRFNLDFGKLATIFALVILPFLSLHSQLKTNSDRWFDKPFYWATGQIQNSFFSYSTGLQNFVTQYLSLVGIIQENHTLKTQNEELKAELLQFKTLQGEIDHLRSTLGFRERATFKYMDAEVIGFDLFGEFNSILIDRGEEDGVKKGEAVISSKGAVGYILRVLKSTSLVLFIGDRNAVVDAMAERTHSRGIVEGRGNFLSEMLQVDKGQDIQAEDLIVTSGMDQTFPKGIPLARVQRVENRASSASLRVVLKPLVAPQELQTVYVVKK